MWNLMYLIGYMYLGWILFIAYAAAAAQWSQLPKIIKALLIPAGILGYSMDVIFNCTVAILLFLELPKTLTLTQRMHSHLQDTGWRGVISKWVCKNMLDAFQVHHCE